MHVKSLRRGHVKIWIDYRERASWPNTRLNASLLRKSGKNPSSIRTIRTILKEKKKRAGKKIELHFVLWHRGERNSRDKAIGTSRLLFRLVEVQKVREDKRSRVSCSEYVYTFD